MVGFGTLCGNLYRFDLFNNGLNYSVNSFIALNAQELMIMPQCYGISVWDIFLGIEWKG